MHVSLFPDWQLFLVLERCVRLFLLEDVQSVFVQDVDLDVDF